MRIAIRVDASTYIGSGHVMRCLALAMYLRKLGGQCLFISRPCAGNMLAFIEAQGFAVAALSHNDVAALDVAADAQQSLQAIEQHYSAVDCLAIDCLIVDHYGLDAEWEQLLQPAAKKIVVIDDLANRPHACDLLLDQGAGKKAVDYDPLMKRSSQLLLGPRYALLRDEFSRWRKAAYLKHRVASSVQHVLIALGGADSDNHTATVLDVLNTFGTYRNLQITVVLGGLYPYTEQLQALATASRHSVRVLTQVNNMAELMAKADVAIGAAGASTWERCVLSLPSITLCVADNQRENCAVVAAEQAALVIYTQQDDLRLQLTKLLPQALTQPNHAMAEQAYRMCDGLGCYRAAMLIAGQSIDDNLDYVEAETEDCELVYQWQCHEASRRYALNPQPPSWPEHQAWFAEVLADSQRRLFIVRRKGQALGLFRLDFDSEDEALISLLISPQHYGQGLATQLLRFVRYWWHDALIKAVVLDQNGASIRAFEKAGYQRTSTGFVSQVTQ